jgi:hypothetical protein
MNDELISARPLNGKERLIGAIVLSAAALLGFYNGIPWATKDTVANIVVTFSTSLARQDQDVANLRITIEALENRLRVVETTQARVVERIGLNGPRR